MGNLLRVVGYVVTLVALIGLVDAVRRPAAAFVANNKLTKPIWCGILAAAAIVSHLFPLLGGGGILTTAGLVGSILYLVDVKPAVSGSNNSSW